MIKKTFFLVLIHLIFLHQVEAQDYVLDSLKKEKINFVQLSFSPDNDAVVSSTFAGMNGYYNNTLTIDVKYFRNIRLFFDQLALNGGLMFSSTFNPNFGQLGLAVDLRFFFSKNIDAPYLFLQFDKSFPVSSYLLNGMGLRLGFGYRFQVKKYNYYFDMSAYNRTVVFDNGPVNTSQNTAFTAGAYFSISMDIPSKKETYKK